MVLRRTKSPVVISLFFAFLFCTFVFGTFRRTQCDPPTDFPPASPNISIGINLATSYGAITARYPDGSFVTASANGTLEYWEVMARLSRPSSQHLA
jgi:hypothetical protein